jgi:4-aminobutyrate aminotransferase-like enzyme
MWVPTPPAPPLATRLLSGNQLPKMLVDPPGPKARAFSARLAASEAPGINTLYGNEPNILWQEALGANVLDVDGNRYLDLTSGFGVAAIGHRHPAILRAIQSQGEKLLHGLGDACGYPARVELAERLVDIAPCRPARVHFAVSGADAVEIALKTALLARPRRERLISFDPAYHGMSLGALNASSRPLFRAPFESQLAKTGVRLPFGGDLSELVRQLGTGKVAAVLVEPVVGREGVLFPPDGWLAEIERHCRRTETVLIFDEIFTGFGRLGELFAFRLAGVEPDLVCCGKALGGGLPIAAVVGRQDLLDSWRSPGEALHTGTFVAHPLACAAALATLEVLASDDLVARAARLGREIAPRLQEWPERFLEVAAVRGRGLLWGIELRHAPAAQRLVQGCRRRGVLLLAGGPEGTVAQLVPSLAIAERQLMVAMNLIEETLTA